jgi:hypothetical protein
MAKRRTQYVHAEELVPGDVIIDKDGDLTVKSAPSLVHIERQGYKMPYVQLEGEARGATKNFRYPYESSVQIVKR